MWVIFKSRGFGCAKTDAFFDFLTISVCRHSFDSSSETKVMRHTTRGGWKPIRHLRILKPEVQKDEGCMNGNGGQHIQSVTISVLSGGTNRKVKDIDI